jgi:hypothetical protein
MAILLGSHLVGSPSVFWQLPEALATQAIAAIISLALLGRLSRSARLLSNRRVEWPIWAQLTVLILVCVVAYPQLQNDFEAWRRDLIGQNLIGFLDAVNLLAPLVH